MTVPRSVSLTERLGSSALGFGCANIFREPSAKRRLRLLELAYDCGVTHFDVAPMYGLGVAESELGRFARQRRDRIVIATKFGLVCTRFARQVARIQAPVRQLFLAMPSLRERARSSAVGPSSGLGGSLLYAKHAYDSRSARVSLERSLRALRTDYVDLFLLHDPEPADLQSETIRPFLEQAVSRGDIREWGIAGEPEVAFAAARCVDGLVPVMQIRDDIFERPSDHRDGGDSRIAFGVLARSLATLRAHLAEPSTRQRWSDATGVDCGSTHELASLLLRDAFVANPRGTVLYTSTLGERIRAASLLASAPALLEPGLEAFRSLVDFELRGEGRAAAP